MRACATLKSLRKVTLTINEELKSQREEHKGIVARANVAKRWRACEKRRRGVVTSSARVGVVVMQRHLNMGQCYHRARLTVALCHSVARKGFDVGDSLLIVSPSPKQSRGCMPQEYKDAVKQSAGRALAMAMTIDNHYTPEQYYTKEGLGRPDCIYRAVGADEAAGGTMFEDADGNQFVERSRRRFGEHKAHKRDLAGKILASRNFVRCPSDLAGAPCLPPALANVFAGGFTGRGLKWLDGAALASARRLLSGL